MVSQSQSVRICFFLPLGIVVIVSHVLYLCAFWRTLCCKSCESFLRAKLISLLRENHAAWPGLLGPLMPGHCVVESIRGTAVSAVPYAAWLLISPSVTVSSIIIALASVRGLLFCRGLGALQVLRVHWQVRGFALSNCAQVLDALCVRRWLLSRFPSLCLSRAQMSQVLGRLQRVAEGRRCGTCPDI